MKAFYGKKKLKTDVIKEVEKEYTRRYTEHQNQIQADVAHQVVAMVLYTLETGYGFKAKRLKDFMTLLEMSLEEMEGVEKIKPFDAIILLERYRKMGIDIEKLIEVKPCKIEEEQR